MYATYFTFKELHHQIMPLLSSAHPCNQEQDTLLGAIVSKTIKNVWRGQQRIFLYFFFSIFSSFCCTFV